MHKLYSNSSSSHSNSSTTFEVNSSYFTHCVWSQKQTIYQHQDHPEVLQRATRWKIYHPQELSLALVHLVSHPSSIGYIQKPPLCSIESPSVSAKVQNFTVSQGYVLENRSVGLLLNLELRNSSTRTRLAYLTGVLLPNRLHIESYKALPRDRCGGLLAVSPGMLLFIAALARASEARISSVYGLVIDDSPDQHRSLVRYLIRFGGEKVMRVTDELKCVPARIFYGGFGTVIRGNVDQMLHRGLLMLERTDKQTST